MSASRPEHKLSPALRLDSYTRDLIRTICGLAGERQLLAFEADRRKLRTAIRRHDTAALFDWMMIVLNFQGVSDRAAATYLERHGSVTWQQITERLAAEPACRKLQNYWQFAGCRYDKGRRTCAAQHHFTTCPLPRHDLRNGRLNQTAYSLYLFFRDVARGDIVSFITGQLSGVSEAEVLSGHAAVSLIDAFRGIYGASDKMMAMTLSTVLLAAPRQFASWRLVGGSLIVVDTLVHNFFVRTGVLQRCSAEHDYGPACYGAHGCADIIRAAAAEIDASRYTPDYPQHFARFVQHSIWRYCSQSGLDVCNGNNIDRLSRCNQRGCRLFSACDRKPLVSL